MIELNTHDWIAFPLRFCIFSNTRNTNSSNLCACVLECQPSLYRTHYVFANSIENQRDQLVKLQYWISYNRESMIINGRFSLAVSFYYNSMNIIRNLPELQDLVLSKIVDKCCCSWLNINITFIRLALFPFFLFLIGCFFFCFYFFVKVYKAEKEMGIQKVYS